MKLRPTAIAVCIATLPAISCSKESASSNSDDSTSFVFDDTSSVSGRVPTVLGAPVVTELELGAALCFDGVDDGLVFDENPIQGRAAFTIEALFRADSAGPAAQRFVHVQENGSENRAMVETRVSENSFYLDTFLSSQGSEVTLAEPTRLHPTATFHWAALSYDGDRMRQFVDGVEELSGELPFAPLGPGQLSVGVRLNRQYWFKGCIREIRFTPRALGTAQLQKLSAR